MNKALLFLILLAQSICVFAQNKPIYISGSQDMVGCWERIVLNDASMKELNKMEPWPQPYQWYLFYEDGSLITMEASVEMKIGTCKEMMAKLSDKKITQNYKWLGAPGRVLTTHKDADQNIPWIVSVIDQQIDKKIYGVPIPAGSLVMMIYNPEKQEVIYTRFLKKIP